MDGAVLVWRNHRGQVLGAGLLLSATDLLVGTNTITLTATNIRGMTASASVVVVVDDDLRLPGPYLSVGPDQVGWRLAPGTTALQSPAVARLFTTPVQNAIEASWKAVQGGQLPLPIEYQALTTAEAPDDRRFLAGYFGRLGAIDPAAAEGFRKVLQGIGVTV